jgi:hypothetical protein
VRASDRAATVRERFPPGLPRPVVTLLALFSLCVGVPTPVSGGEEPSEYQIKAAFLLNFIRFVEWPAEAFKTAADPLVVGILGKDPFDGALEQIVSNKTVNGRAVTIRRISDAAAARSCHVVFLAASETRRMSDVTSTVVSRGLLIVGESDGFAERGGMINFIVQDNHVRFQINPAAAARAGLKVSSKLLQLADVVSDKPRGK